MSYSSSIMANCCEMCNIVGLAYRKYQNSALGVNGEGEGGRGRGGMEKQ